MEPKLKPKFLEILAHPLRQEILVYIEQEGETGYKDLKNKFNVATGTLYHHLRFLKGLIEQNSSKKYILTDEGRKALNVLFQEDTPSDESVIEDHQLNNNETINIIKEETIDESQEVSAIVDSQLTNTEQESNSRSDNKTNNPFSTSIFTTLLKNRTNSYFNINQIINSLPAWFFKFNIGFFIILPVVLFMIQPKVVFFHFIPIQITNSFYAFIMIIFPAFNLIVLFCISFLKQEKVSLPTLAILSVYYNLVFIITIVFNIFNLLHNDIVVRIFSIAIQGLFILFWTLSLSLQYYSWERSLFLAILQNYILFLFF